MSKRYRRYEILLPRVFNDGKRVPDKLFSDTFAELRTQFHAASHETQSILGSWEARGRIFEDILVRYFVDVPDTLTNRRFFLEFKRRLKRRFDQVEIWITSYRIDVL